MYVYGSLTRWPLRSAPLFHCELAAQVYQLHQHLSMPAFRVPDQLRGM